MFGFLYVVALLEAARRVALTVRDPELRQDVAQAAWLKYMEWPPTTVAGAFKAARWARDTLLREEPHHADVELWDVEEPHDEVGEDAALRVDRLQLLEPEKIRFLLSYAQRRHHTNAETVKAHRYRKHIKEGD